MNTRRRPSGTMTAVTGTTGVGDPFSINTSKPASGLIVTIATGSANPAFADRLRFLLMSEIDSEPRDWILNASAIERFERDTSQPFVDILTTFKERGGGRIIVIASDGIKMMLSSISMSSVASGGPTLEIVATMKEALQRLGRAEDGKAGAE